MRSLARAATGFILIWSGIACASADTLKVAVIENLSGPGSTTNREFALATRYWVEHVKTKGGTIEYIEYDNQGSTSTAAEKFRSAIADGAHIIVQGGSSGVAGQLTDDVRRHNLRNPDQPRSRHRSTLSSVAPCIGCPSELPPNDRRCSRSPGVRSLSLLI